MLFRASLAGAGH